MLGEEDLRFKLTVDPDTAKMQEAIKDIGKDLDQQAAQAKATWNDLGKAGAAQLESIRANERIAQGFAAPSQAADKRALAMQSITKDMERQRDLLERINAELDPQTLKERVTLERQLAESRAKYVKAHDAERKAQSPEPEQGRFRQFISHLVSGQGLNLRQLAGSAIGGGIGGGSGGALGAVAGGAGAQALSGALGPLGVAAGVAVGGVFLLTDAITKMTGAIAGFVAVSSPGAFVRWQYTVRDFEGVIGQRLTPLLSLMTDGLRSFADALADILPSQSQIQAVAEGIRELFRVFSLGSKNALADVYHGLTLRPNEVFVRDPKTGALKPAGDHDSSFGAAARPAHFTSVEDFGRDIQQQALTASTLNGSIPQKQLTVLEKIYNVLSKGGEVKTPGVPNFGDLVDKIMPDRFGKHRALYGHP